MTTPPPKNSDLGVRAASAVVMLAVAGTALWLGGWWWTVFVAAVALGVLWEWWGLVGKFNPSALGKAIWLVTGVAYVGIAAAIIIDWRVSLDSLELTLGLLLAVVATDVCAYFTGRTFGGPKIAKKISPSKTWSGLIGGVFGASLALFMLSGFGCMSTHGPVPSWAECIIWSANIEFIGMVFAVGSTIAIVAQAGDFFESWMKRRAGVKDSSNLIPGHGGLFDRVDGLLAVSFVIGLVTIAGTIAAP